MAQIFSSFLIPHHNHHQILVALPSQYTQGPLHVSPPPGVPLGSKPPSPLPGIEPLPLSGCLSFRPCLSSVYSLNSGWNILYKCKLHHVTPVPETLRMLHLLHCTDYGHDSDVNDPTHVACPPCSLTWPLTVLSFGSIAGLAFLHTPGNSLLLYLRVPRPGAPLPSHSHDRPLNFFWSFGKCHFMGVFPDLPT